MRIAAVLLFLAALGVVAVPGVQADEPPQEREAFIADLVFGEHWNGAEITLDDLTGKVVLFVLWGS